MNSSNILKLGAAAAVAATLLAAASGAIARTPAPVTVIGRVIDDGALRVHVAYADLDLASARGERLLNRRVVFAANTVCAPFDYASLRYDRFAACARAAKSDAAPQVDQALRRAREIAMTGSSAIPMAAIAVTASLPA